MAKFSSPAQQAASVMQEQQGGSISSVGTVRNYEQALTRVAEHIQQERAGTLRDMTPERAESYLEQRGQEVGQKTIDMERQALQSMMQNVTGQLAPNEKLAVVRSEQQQQLTSRAYTPEQVQAVANAQSERNALATEIAHTAGLRAHELHTLAPTNERAADDRPALSEKFSGRDGVPYTVEGKGGLTREVRIPAHLAERLEARRHETPVQVRDRGVNYTSRYDIGGGKNWSQSYSAASTRTLGWSEGAHGVRHSYAQERMSELQANGLSRNEALETVSQEMGHFRPEITETYLR